MNPQIVIREGVRLIVFVSCIGFTLFAIDMMAPEKAKEGWCNPHHATDWRCGNDLFNYRLNPSYRYQLC